MSYVRGFIKYLSRVVLHTARTVASPTDRSRVVLHTTRTVASPTDLSGVMLHTSRTVASPKWPLTGSAAHLKNSCVSPLTSHG